MDMPCSANDYQSSHVKLLAKSYRQLLAQPWSEENLGDKELAKAIFFAPFAVLSHNTAEDPVFNYGNLTALELFRVTWQELVHLPSRSSAEIMEQTARERLLAEVSQKGYISHYEGIRIAKNGTRFLIKNATVWNLIDEQGSYCGQAARFSEWQEL